MALFVKIERGHEVRSGYWADRGGGMMVFQATDITQAKAIVFEDPLVKNGCVAWELHEWKIAAG